MEYQITITWWHIAIFLFLAMGGVGQYAKAKLLYLECTVISWLAIGVFVGIFIGHYL